MDEDDFKISSVNGTISIEKDGQRFTINQASDEDIWFATSTTELSLDIRKYSSVYSEWQTYMVFEKLMKTIVGRYMLSGHNKSDAFSLPKDFIDLDNNVITWHSDSGIDNILKLDYNERIITISLLKSKDALQNETNSVRIRTSGSNYKYYYQEFLDFFSTLSELGRKLNKSIEVADKKSDENTGRRKVFLFNKKRR